MCELINSRRKYKSISCYRVKKASLITMEGSEQKNCDFEAEQKTSRTAFCAKSIRIALILTTLGVAVPLNQSAFSCSMIKTNSTTTTCTFTVAPFVIETATGGFLILTIIPNTSTIVILLLRFLQLAGFFGLKTLVQKYQSQSDILPVTMEYFAYALLCGLMLAEFAGKIPNKTKKTKSVTTILTGLTIGIAIISEFTFNQYQTWRITDLWMFLGFIPVVAMTTVILYKLIVRHKTDDLKHEFVSFVVGYMPLMYMVIPVTQFHFVFMQIIVTMAGLAVYITIFTINVIS